jgi:integrase
MELKDFNAKMAGEYMDYWILEKKVRNTTYNNKLMFIKILFTTLVEREYILKNPFRFIKPKKAIKKLRRNFNDEEKLIISSYIKKHDTWLYYGLILQYYCFIRPTELRRLKFKDFDLQNGIIQLTEETTKSRKAFPVTIPNFLRDDFLDPIFKKQPADYFVFGSGLRPDPLKPCSKNTMNYRHRQILERLLKMKKLKSIEGLSWYSWKDTGLTDLAGDIAPRDLQEQARHYSFDVTETYLHRKKVIQSIQNLKLRRI